MSDLALRCAGAMQRAMILRLCNRDQPRNVRETSDELKPVLPESASAARLFPVAVNIAVDLNAKSTSRTCSNSIRRVLRTGLAEACERFLRGFPHTSSCLEILSAPAK